MTLRKIVIPGEVILSGNEYLPGNGVEKVGKDIISKRFGLAEESNKLVKIIPLSGIYEPRRGNVIIGKVEMLTMGGWVINFGNAENAFLSIMEVPKFIPKGALDEFLNIGDMIVAKIFSIKGRNIDLSIKGGKEFGKIDEGIVFKINPNKVPRIIGKEGSMINLIKEKTGCNIVVGQNGYIWIKGNTIEKEILAKEAIIFIVENSFLNGLTNELEKFFNEKK